MTHCSVSRLCRTVPVESEILSQLIFLCLLSSDYSPLDLKCLHQSSRHLLKQCWKSNGMRLPTTLDKLVLTPLHSFKVCRQSKVTWGIVRGERWVRHGRNSILARWASAIKRLENYQAYCFLLMSQPLLGYHLKLFSPTFSSWKPLKDLCMLLGSLGKPSSLVLLSG